MASKNSEIQITNIDMSSSPNLRETARRRKASRVFPFPPLADPEAQRNAGDVQDPFQYAVIPGSGVRHFRWQYAARDLCFSMAASYSVFVFWQVAFPTAGPLSIGIGARTYAAWALLQLSLMLLVCESFGLYRCRRLAATRGEIIACTKAALVGGTLATAILILSQAPRLPIALFATSTAAVFGACVGWRMLEHAKADRKNEMVRNLMIVGSEPSCATLRTLLDANPRLGYATKHCMDEDSAAEKSVLQRALNEHFIEEIVIALPCSRAVVGQIAAEASIRRLDLTIVPDLSDFPMGYVPLDFLGSIPAVSAPRQPIPEHWLMVKRGFDLCVAILGCLALAPFFLIIALSIKLESKGPVIYRSIRVGRRGKKFWFYKFRTMIPQADAMKATLQHLNERRGLMFKITNDPRVTRIGRVLRKYSLDELPQLFNVIKGDMSLVGPRPPSLEEYEGYSWEHLTRLGVRPGITGLWQVTARHDPCFDQAVALDTSYIRNWSLWLDLSILWKTVPAVLHGEGR
jgi:exopolysaccharide biosynthesis polyprenyl glycosylphosphotransferase